MQEILRAAGRRHEFLLVHDPRQLRKLAQRAASLAQAHAGAVVVAGGDGTINAVAEATLPTGRPFGIVPQGTFNYSSRARGIPLDTVAATRALLDAELTRSHPSCWYSRATSRSARGAASSKPRRAS